MYQTPLSCIGTTYRGLRGTVAMMHSGDDHAHRRKCCTKLDLSSIATIGTVFRGTVAMIHSGRGNAVPNSSFQGTVAMMHSGNEHAHRRGEILYQTPLSSLGKVRWQ